MHQFLTQILLLSLLVGCVASKKATQEYIPIESSRLTPPDYSLNIPNLSPCTASTDHTIHINPDEPINIIVHGCYGSAARFRALAQVFSFHDQSAICFNYNDRDSMMKSSSQLIAALESLSSYMNNKKITIIGHSQGGLIARKSLIDSSYDFLYSEDKEIQLVTVSSPFAGIFISDHCESKTARLISLGLVIPICRMISGDKWDEITRNSNFIQNPGELLDNVEHHLKIVTDERGSCRQYNQKGKCLEDDYVFSTEEQYFHKIDASSKVKNIEISAGHVEIVGDHMTPPIKLIKILQDLGIINQTVPERKSELTFLLSVIY